MKNFAAEDAITWKERFCWNI